MRGLRNRVINRACGYAAVIAVIGLLIDRNFSLGLILGVVISVINFFLLARQVAGLAAGKKALVFGFFGYIIRYLFMGLALFAAIKIDLAAFFGCALGLFMVRLGIYGEQLSAAD